MRTRDEIQADIDDVRCNMPWSDDRDEALDELYQELDTIDQHHNPEDSER